MKKKKLFCGMATAFLLCGCPLAQADTGIYLGVDGYGWVSNKSSFTHSFYGDQGKESYAIASDWGYSQENKLSTGDLFDFTLEGNQVTALEEISPFAQGWVGAVSGDMIQLNGLEIPLAEGCVTGVIYEEAGSVTVLPQEIRPGTTVKVYGNPATHIYETFVGTDYVAPVTGTAGERSLKNFLATAMTPVGTALYIYGGHWNWHDDGASNQATTLGLSSKVTEFFQEQNQYFSYINNGNYSKSYFPHQNWNQYHAVGMDCTGYVGWALYNTLYPYSGGEGLVYKSTQQAYTLANLGYGTYSKDRNFQVGDIFSMAGHVWIYLGSCPDGSFVILHSTPSPSVSGAEGGGVQLTGVGTSPSCQAVALAQSYMETYFPDWTARYSAQYKSYSSYTSMSNWPAGRFSWHSSGAGLLDIDGYAHLSAEEILADLFQGGDFSGVASRGEAVSYLWNALGQPVSGTEIPFVDVENSLVPAVSWAYETGVTLGTSASLFSPENQVTRGQFVCYLWNLASRPGVSAENPFVDVAEDAYYTTALLWAVEQGYTVGTSATTFSPEAAVTREQIVLFLRGFLG